MQVMAHTYAIHTHLSVACGAYDASCIPHSRTCPLRAPPGAADGPARSGACWAAGGHKHGCCYGARGDCHCAAQRAAGAVSAKQGDKSCVLCVREREKGQSSLCAQMEPCKTVAALWSAGVMTCGCRAWEENVFVGVRAYLVLVLLMHQ